MAEVKLPTKTKIAAWLMIIIGILGIAFSVVDLFEAPCNPNIEICPIISRYELTTLELVLTPFLLFLLFVVPGFSLLKRKKWAWWLTVFFLIISLSIAFLAPYLLFSYSVLIKLSSPLILIVLLFCFLDRKNFFKISQ